MKKSFYIFLCSLLGMLLFILLQRSLFLVAFLSGANILSYSYQRFDYFTFVVAMFLGLWYGIWMGLHWFKVVYEEMTEPGMFSGITRIFTPTRSVFGQSKLWNLEDLVNLKTNNINNSNSNIGGFASRTTTFITEVPVHASNLHSRTTSEARLKRGASHKSVKRTPKKA